VVGGWWLVVVIDARDVLCAFSVFPGLCVCNVSPIVRYPWLEYLPKLCILQ